MGSMVRPAPLSFFLEKTMEPDYAVYLDEVMERVSDNYDPYEYIEDEEYDILPDDICIEDFNWEA
tara:strand:- start:1219 stop:1413 length:195 start_codon:yes stop_codon:yes gene_type:complete